VATTEKTITTYIYTAYKWTIWFYLFLFGYSGVICRSIRSAQTQKMHQSQFYIENRTYSRPALSNLFVQKYEKELEQLSVNTRSPTST